MYLFILSQQSCAVGITVFLLVTGRLRLRERKQLAPGYTA